MERKEENIEADILCYFMQNGCRCSEKNILAGYYNEKKGFYQKNKSAFVKTGRSDIQIFRKGQLICIEVKKPSEMSFFDRDIEDLKQRFAQAQCRIKDPKRYFHAVEQRKYLDEIIAEGGIGFFASSVEQVQERLQESGFSF